MIQELRIALRSLGRRPLFTLTAIAMVAVALGSVVAMGSIVRVSLLDVLPYPDADRLVWIWGDRSKEDNSGLGAVSPGAFRELDRSQLGLEGLGAVAFGGSSMIRIDDAEPIEASPLAATADLLEVLGVEPTLGRSFSVEETEVAEPAVALLSDRLWKEVFGGEARALGARITVDGRSLRVVGVLPPSIEAPLDAAVWLPMTWSAPGWTSRQFRFVQPIGRLAEAQTVAGVQTRLDAITQFISDPSAGGGGPRPLVQPLERLVAADHGRALALLFVATLLITGVAGLNFGTLLMTRTASRRREIDLRSALGASRTRIVRQLLVEGSTLGLLGGLLGTLFGQLLLVALVRSAPVQVPGLERASIDPGILAFALLAAILFSILFGLAPAVRFAFPRAADLVRAARNTRLSRPQILVVGEVALTAVVLVGAGLLWSSLARMRTVEPGFRPAGLYSVSVRPGATNELGREARSTALDRMLERLERIPGVVSVGATSGPPIVGGIGAETPVRAGPSGPEVPALFRSIEGDYLSTLGVEVVAGRFLDRSDPADGPLRTVVNRRLARALFGTDDPIGRTVSFQGREAEVVGVLGDVREISLTRPAPPTAYFSMRQHFQPTTIALVLRTAVEPPTHPTVMEALRAVDPAIAVPGIASLEEGIAGTLAVPRFRALVLLVFGWIALGLSFGGVYGVLASLVGERRREIAIRMAVGASGERVVGEVVARGVRLGLAGLAAGLVVAALAGHWIAPLLFDLAPVDAGVFATVAATLLATVAVASWLPARGASLIRPADLLRGSVLLLLILLSAPAGQAKTSASYVDWEEASACARGPGSEGRHIMALTRLS